MIFDLYILHEGKFESYAFILKSDKFMRKYSIAQQNHQAQFHLIDYLKTIEKDTKNDKKIEILDLLTYM